MATQPKKSMHTPTKNEGSPTDSYIDENLKKAFEDTLNEDLPDRFKVLIAELNKKTGGDANDG